MMTRTMMGGPTFPGGQVFQIAQPLPEPAEEILRRLDAQQEQQTDQEEPEAPGFDAMIDLLSNSSSDDPALESTRTEKWFAALELKKELFDVCVSLKCEERIRLHREQENVRELGRKQKELVQELNIAHGRAQEIWNRFRMKTQELHMKVVEAEEAEKTLPWTASASERKAARDLVDKRKTANRAAIEAETDATLALNAAAERYNEESAKYEQLFQQNAALAAKLAGERRGPYGLTAGPVAMPQPK